ncbi:MAG: extracellular solute-binding protein [Chloroflexi bacterium]|nr:extracellular solute-binding protein [Chloroflexota bacterium]
MTPTSATPLPNQTEIPTAMPTAAATPSVSAIDPLVQVTLNFWLPPELAETASTDGYIAQINQRFSKEYPNLILHQLPKALHGPGGITNLLLTAKAAAPAQLPDVVLVDAAELAPLEEAGLTHSPDGYITTEFWDTIYPVMRTAVISSGAHIAIPFVTDLVLLVYDSSMVSSPPAGWTNLTDASASYLFPAAKGDGSSADTFILHYLSLGGKLTTNNGELTLDTQIASQVLRTYRTYMELGALPESIREVATYEECWEMYAAGEAAMTNVLYSKYDANRPNLIRSQYAAVPHMGSESATLARGYAWVIITDDPEKQELAIRYIEMAMQPDALAEWAALQHLLPSRLGSLDKVISDGTYRAFIESLLYSAYPYPNLESYARIQDSISQAIEDVLAGIETPERAAASISEAISSLR